MSLAQAPRRSPPAQLFWVPGPWPGRLAISPRPRGGEWLADEVRSWREAGLSVVVSLLTLAEASELGVREEARLVAEEGLQFHSLPIPDYGVPPSRGSVDELITHLESALAAGRSVAVHCRQGIGRSSLVVAVLLIRQGEEPGEALRRVEQARGRPVPDTDEQREWVQRFASEPLVRPSGATRAPSR